MRVNLSPLLSAPILLALLAGCSVGGSEQVSAPDQLAFSEPVTDYGDDVFLDLLWEACAATGGAACNALWERSPIGSSYEAFALTCGERGNVTVCNDDSVPPGPGLLE